MRKILFVITQGFWGGAQKYVLDLALSLHTEYHISIAIGNDQAKEFEKNLPAHSSKIDIIPLKHLKRDISPVHDILGVFELHRLYKQLQPDIVHLNSSKAGILGSFARTPETKIVYTAHGWVFLEPLGTLRTLIYFCAEKITSHYKDTIIVLSKEDWKVAREKLHIPKEKLAQVPLGISQIQFLQKNTAKDTIRAYNPSLKPEKIWCVTIANHYKTKGLEILIESIALLAPEYRKKLQCIVIGDGPERKSLQKRIHSHKLEETIFLLPSIANASTLLKAFDFFALPSHKEGLPYTLLEALQAGLPLIATNVGGIPSLLTHKKNGLLVAPNNPVSLKNAIEELLQNQASWPKISEYNKKESNKYSLSRIKTNTNDVYTSLLPLE